MTEGEVSYAGLQEQYPGLDTHELTARLADHSVNRITFRTAGGEELGSHNAYPGNTHMEVVVATSLSRGSGCLIHSLVDVMPVVEEAPESA